MIKIISKYEIIIYWSEDDNCFVTDVPELPRCMSDGNTYSEALKNTDVVIQEWIDTTKELKREIPIPKGRLVYA